MKVYLAGKITGDPNYREKFAAAAKKLEERAGVTVISPAVTPEGLKKADYMRICFAMLESADTAVGRIAFPIFAFQVAVETVSKGFRHPCP